MNVFRARGSEGSYNNIPLTGTGLFISHAPRTWSHCLCPGLFALPQASWVTCVPSAAAQPAAPPVPPGQPSPGTPFPLRWHPAPCNDQCQRAAPSSWAGGSFGTGLLP